MKNYSGKLNFSLTGIQNSAAFPVINGCATIIIRDVLISITKIDKKTVRIQMIINIPKLNTGPRTYGQGNVLKHIVQCTT